MVAFLCNKGSDHLISMKVIGTPLFQWEVGRQVEIIPLQNMRVDSVHFSNPGDAIALVVKPKELDGRIIADVPNVLLQKGSNLVVYSVNISDDCVETIRDCVLPVRNRPKPSDYVYTETEVLEYRTLKKRIDEIEKNGVSEAQIATAVEKYLEENPVDTGVKFEPDHTLTLQNGILSVNTTNDMEQDNTLPITSAGVFATVGNIEVLLKTI
jgi:hypothetical protein